MQAYFITGPRTQMDLKVVHMRNHERPYEIVKTIDLEQIDYENFVTDMLADRQFIEDYATLCHGGETLGCLLIREAGHTDGVLVFPDADRPGYIQCAAYLE